ncbi:MAG: homoserine kinase [Candidatus Liptonbacteria bacterium]|nr:homoserine kinase [Candidatus Liptonbacteria bacterium]
MTAKATISKQDFVKIIADYELGEYKGFRTFANGVGQTTILIETTKGKFVLRYYENRSPKHVLFEVRLFNYLRNKNYPVPAIIKNRRGGFSGKYNGKPYIIIEFVDGRHCKNPNDFFDSGEAAEVVRVVAELHNLTEAYSPRYFKDREVFDAEYCWREFKGTHPRLIKNAKGKWFHNELGKLKFPDSLPRGLCHADLNYGNFLFRGGKVVAVLDFDMSFRTNLIYDVASLIYWWAWPPRSHLRENEAGLIVGEYIKTRGLTGLEKAHIYDALKLIILLGIIWSGEEDFAENKAKIEFLNSIGRDNFYSKLSNQH